MSQQPPEWFVRKAGGEVYGPVNPEKLRRWAEAGRIAPEDSVSTDRVHWAPAPGVADLRMKWFVDLPDGATCGPLNLHVFADLLEEGSLAAGTVVRHAETGEQRTLEPGFVADDAPPAPRPAPAAPAAPPAEPPSFRQTAQEREQFEREARRWKQLYDEERASAEQAQGESEARARQLQEESIGLRAALERAQHEAEQLRRALQSRAAAGAPDPAGDEALATAHAELSRSFETLGASFAEKVTELRGLREEMERLQRESDERVLHAEQQLQRERESANEARRRLAATEASYVEVVRALREMNDRYIRARERLPAPAAAPRPPPAPSAPAPSAPPAAAAPAEAAPRTGPRIRLTR